MTEARRLTDEEQKWADATMDNTKAWLVPSLRAAAGRVAESRAREGELVAALEAAKEDLEHNCDECTRLREENTDWAAWPSCDEGLRLGHRAGDLRRAALAQGKKE